MLNIVRNEVSEEQLAEAFASVPKEGLLPKIGSAEWAQVAKKESLQDLLMEIRSRALAELDEPMPALTDELYAHFSKTGIRLPFEKKWFDRRRRLARAAIAALFESDPATQKKFLQSMLRKMEDTFAETSWAFPAHVDRAKLGKDPMKIDLFAAETANLFGELLNLFEGHIPQDFVDRIHERLRVQMFENYLADPPHWSTVGMNWNAVCHQGIGGAALATVENSDLLAKLFKPIAKGLRLFLEGFAKDGGSSEGPGYWGYGFGWMMELNRQLEKRTKGKLSLFEGDKHAHAIAQFGPIMTLANGYSVNFSDNGPRSSPRASMLQYLGERFNDEFIRAHARVAWARSLANGGIDLNHQRSDLFHLTRVLLDAPDSLPKSAGLPAGETFLPALGVAVIRFYDAKNRLWEFACKGGDNAEHHNHNDIGSYLLNINGERALTEIGAPEYVHQFFNEGRYTFLAARSMGHPVPLINGVEQAAGSEYRGKVLKADIDGPTKIFRLDMTAAYPESAECASCFRTFTIDSVGGVIQVEDVLELKKSDSLESAVMTHSPVELHGNVAQVRTANVVLKLTALPGTSFREVQKHEYNGHEGQAVQVNRLVMMPEKLGPRVAMGCRIEIG